MKHNSFLFLLCLLVGCTNGLQKPITEALSVDEIRGLIKKDAAFEERYKKYRDIGDWVLSDNLLTAKYGSITYKQVEEYSLFKLDENAVLSEYQQMYPDVEQMHHQADSILQYYRSHQPDSLIRISFKNKSIRRTILGNTPVFTFVASPTKDGVDGFRFEYYFSKNISGERTIDDIPYTLIRRGYHDTPVLKETTITCLGELWTDVLEDVSSEELSKDYRLLYRITNVRYHGENWIDVPYTIQRIVEKEPPYDNRDLDDVIVAVINKDFTPYLSFYLQKWADEASVKYPEQDALFDEFYQANPDYILGSLAE